MEFLLFKKVFSAEITVFIFFLLTNSIPLVSAGTHVDRSRVHIYKQIHYIL